MTWGDADRGEDVVKNLSRVGEGVSGESEGLYIAGESDWGDIAVDCGEDNGRVCVRGEFDVELVLIL